MKTFVIDQQNYANLMHSMCYILFTVFIIYLLLLTTLFIYFPLATPIFFSSLRVLVNACLFTCEISRVARWLEKVEVKQ